MEPSEEMCKSLAKWLQKTVPNKTNTIPEICDGVAMLDALLQISPEHFSKLELKIKKDVGVNNWRLRISNLKKIVEAVIEYYQDVLTLQILDVGIPDVNQIGENNDAVQLAKLLRLILGCAINCDRKQEYITLIMQMEESIQQNIMQAIQQLEEVTGGPGRSGLSLLILDSDTRVMKLVSDLESSNKSREGLIQQVETLEQQVQSLLYEKRILQDQNQALLEKEAKNPQENIRKQLDTLKEELFKSEVRAEDLKSKLLEKEKQMITFQEKINELQVSANESAKLKDEIDALTESAGKVADLELAIVSYKKRLENYQDIKKTLQKLEEKNMEYIQKNMEMEEELAKNNTWKSQCEAYKSQIVELQQKLDEETQRADKAQFNLDKIKSKIISLQGEKERLILERDNLKEEIEELKLGPKESGAAVSEELTQTELEKRLKLVEKENKTLRSSSQEMESKQAQLDSSLNRIEKLQQKNRNLNQTVLKLEAQIEELKMQQTETQGISINSSIVKEYRQKISILQETLASKDNELQSLQTKYNRSVEKAREVAQHLEFKSNASLTQSNIKELEGRLLTAAFHRLTINSHRESMDERLSVLHGAQGQSFLSRQRTPTPRKPIQRYKSK
ncbi:protein hook-like [Diorhabda carinulata]|uniref:protein hook-like n=1 Tax=Diorhabda carinulata TaxID=1163345 RepID=UPI0025A0187A|nr:protein hook-like [Diorhabda carinulata]